MLIFNYNSYMFSYYDFNYVSKFIWIMINYLFMFIEFEIYILMTVFMNNFYLGWIYFFFRSFCICFCWLRVFFIINWSSYSIF